MYEAFVDVASGTSPPSSVIESPEHQEVYEATYLLVYDRQELIVP